MLGIQVLVVVALCCCCCFFCSYASKEALDAAAKCTNILMSTDIQLKNKQRNNSSLRVVVPWKVGFEEFVKFQPHSCMVDGFSVQVFLQALRYMPQHLRFPPYQFVVHGTGDQTPHYDDMIDMLVREEVDVVVADLTITRERMDKVAFTVPYLPSSLAMVTPFRYGSAGTLWDFLKPFSENLWITLLLCFIATGVALYFLEDQNPDFAITSKKDSEGRSPGGSSTHSQASSMPNAALNNTPSPHFLNATQDPSNDVQPPMAPNHAPPPVSRTHSDPNNSLPINDLSSLQCLGPPIYDQASRRRRVMNAYWFTCLCVFQAQQESVRTHLGRIVTVTWLFAMIIFNSSYTASLASLLSAQKRYPSIQGFQSLMRDVNISVGYQSGSFMQTYMNNIHMAGHRIRRFASAKDFAQALRKGSPDGVGAVLDELPYVQILLQSQCDLTISSTSRDHLPAFGGFAFAFRKGDQLMDQMSKMIMALAEDATLEVLKNGWNIGDNTKSDCNSDQEPLHLRLRDFGGLFSIVAAVYLTCLIWRFSTKVIKSSKGACVPFMRAIPCSQNASTVHPVRHILSRRYSNNRVQDEASIDYTPS